MENLSLLDKNDLKEVLETLIREAVRAELKCSSVSGEISPVMSRDEVCKMLHISLPTLNQWEKDGTIPKPKRLGKRVYFIRKDFIAFLESDNQDSNHKQ
ncbi:helix-turn-helix domain-containing protein [Flavobacteriales bacterium]|nr:helix-turn-helix domain-containing protein [Flavobacteriales bacterium]